MSNKNDHDTYIIPPNFIETGTFFGGMFRARNVIEAGILVFAIGAPVFLFLPFGLTTRIIILCLTALPVGLVALIGISGESLSQFLVTFLKYLRNRRVVGGDGEQPEDMEQGRENEIDHIPAAEFAAPRSIDFSHGRYSKHPESSKLRDCKASAHIPEWRELEEQAQPKPAAAPPPAPKPKESAPKKPAAKRKPKSSGTPAAPKSPPSPPASEAPDGIITTDKDSILS
ncbi:PrgI family protein [Flavonifractor sp. An4]|uniref:PrgI family protein n=1 Tax=Flavonifractor sp. An4 TaxID=1965634 RepID=UPI000B3A7E05|nr:PrgI family protein [Flavonifractor sp. An4]OUO16217.1 hypothetical protein B5F94_06105 [Flavonifractor sp. An4]